MKILVSSIFCLSLFTVLFSGCNTDSNLVSPDEKTVFSKSDFKAFSGRDSFVGSISQEEVDALVHMRIEEKIARDAYTVLGEQWNRQVFLNIKLSEQTHMDAVKKLLDKYSIPDPLVTDEVGVFPNESFQELYDGLITQGKESVYNAFLVGVAIEELDIKDLDEYLLIVDNSDIVQVFNHLLDGSYNHLTAFNKNLSK
jgi:hypothetical protein